MVEGSAMGAQSKSSLKLVAAPLAIMCIVYLVYAWDRVIVPVELVEMKAAYGLSLAASGLIASVFTFGLALTALPAGLFVARWGLRATLVLGAVLFSVCTAYSPIGFGLADLMTVRVLAGVGEGFYNVAMYSFLATLTQRYRGAAAGIAGTLFGLGVLSGPPIISRLQTYTADWRMPFFILAAIGIAGAASIGVCLRGHRRAPAAAATPILPRLRQFLTWPNLAVCFATGVNGIGVYAFISMYVTFLRSVWHFDQATASYIFSAYGLGGLLGGIPMGYIADRIGRQSFLAAAFLLAGCAVVGTFAAAPLIVPSVTINFALGMLFNGIYSNCYALMQDRAPKADIPIATGLLATVYFLTASFSGWLLVRAAKSLGWPLGALMVLTVPYVLCAILFLTRATQARDALAHHA